MNESNSVSRAPDLDNNMKSMNISVCMATFNGERFLSEQVASILTELSAEDELIVLDDASQDGTVAFFERLQDPRVKIHRNERNLGHVQTFSKVLSLAANPLIFMADQDDVWLAGRVDTMRHALADHLLVSTWSEFMDGEGQPIEPLHPGLDADQSDQYAGNIARIFSGRAYYDGCAMALRAELRPIILPIPSYVESHDLWIAMAANIAKSNRHLERYTLRRRVHGGNASVVSRPFLRKLMSRAIFLLSWMHISLRLIKR